MKHKRLAIAIALLLAGCGTQAIPSANPAAPSDDPLGLGDAIAPRYQALSQHATVLSIANVSASSTGSEVSGFSASASSVRDARWFSVSNLTDGNLHSAWGPADNDTAPMLTLSLAQATQLTGLGIKMDDGATFDVEVNNGGAWTTIATSVTPQYRALDFISLPASTAQQVRLVFHVRPNAQLLVCEAKLFCGGTGTPSMPPSTMPSPTPTPVPTASPSPSGCLSLNLNGDLYTDGSESFGPPTTSISLTAAEDAQGGVFGYFGASFSGAIGPFGVVKSIHVSGNTVTVIANETDDSEGAYSPGADITITAQITSRSGDSFDGYITNVDVPSESFGDVSIAHPSGALTMHGSYGACIPSPFECFSLEGESVFFSDYVPNSPGNVITISNFVHAGGNTSGTIKFGAFSNPNSGPTGTGQITSAVVANDTMTLSGTLNGGTFKLTFEIFEADAQSFQVAPTSLVETDANGHVTFQLAPQFNPDISAGIDGRFGCP